METNGMMSLTIDDIKNGHIFFHIYQDGKSVKITECKVNSMVYEYTHEFGEHLIITLTRACDKKQITLDTFQWDEPPMQSWQSPWTAEECKIGAWIVESESRAMDVARQFTNSGRVSQDTFCDLMLRLKGSCRRNSDQFIRYYWDGSKACSCYCPSYAYDVFSGKTIICNEERPNGQKLYKSIEECENYNNFEISRF